MTKKEITEKMLSMHEDLRERINDISDELDEKMYEIDEKIRTLQRQVICDHRWSYNEGNGMWGNYYYAECKNCSVERYISEEKYNDAMRKKFCTKPKETVKKTTKKGGKL
jgi:hypothetical protein